jgi:hypothetical protein
MPAQDSQLARDGDRRDPMATSGADTEKGRGRLTSRKTYLAPGQSPSRSYSIADARELTNTSECGSRHIAE